ncbi:MAG: cbb3-type cytochrome oxidase subunit 3 [Alphaproteobacteria bacterium]
MMDTTDISELLRPLWLVWLVVVFLGIAFWAYRPGNKARFEKDARIVFDDENDGGKHG